VLEFAHGLSGPQLEAIGGLEARCRVVDDGRLKLEWGSLRRRDPDQVNDLLVWDGQDLVGFCGRYSFSGQQAEATGMVDPAHRGAGLGDRLLTEILGLCDAHGDPSVLLVTARSSDAARRLAERHGGTFDHAEHALELRALDGSGAEDASVTLRPATADDVDALRRLLVNGFGEGAGPVDVDDPTGTTLLAERDGVPVATLRVTDEASARGVYGFVVDPALRGQGVGRDLLRRVCADALAHGATAVHLEVAVDNDRALGLYTSLGFERRTTEDYYRFVTTR
jgi:ribosomal protein S18 acetylase RimI-like enzyme